MLDLWGFHSENFISGYSNAYWIVLKKLPDKHSSVSGADEMEILYKFGINLGFIKPFKSQAWSTAPAFSFFYSDANPGLKMLPVKPEVSLFDLMMQKY